MFPPWTTGTIEVERETVRARSVAAKKDVFICVLAFFLTEGVVERLEGKRKDELGKTVRRN